MTNPKSKPYWWFTGASVRALADQLQAAGPDTARLEVHLDAKKNMTLRVVRVASDGDAGSPDGDCTPINDSRVCPPICP